MKNLKINFKKIVALVATGSMILVGANACSNKKSDKESETTIEVNEENIAANSNQQYYDEIKEIESNVTSFINDILKSGALEEAPSEADKDDLARAYLNYYLMMNQEKISPEVFEILNQNNEINDVIAYNDSLAIKSVLQYQSIISTPDTKLDFTYIIKDQNDRELIENLANLVSELHVAIENKEQSSIDRITEQFISIKEDMISNNSKYSMMYNSYTVNLALMYLDAADIMTNSGIISDEEDKAQILNSSFVKCLDNTTISSMSDERIKMIASEIGISNYENMTREEILNAISDTETYGTTQVSMRSASEITAKNIFASRIESLNTLGEYDSIYSYRKVIDVITSGINLSLYKEAEKYVYEFVNENNIVDYNGIGSQTTIEVTPDQVPENMREETTSTSVDENNNPTNDDYLRGKTAGITAGDSIAFNSYATVLITESQVSVPSGVSAEYARGYKDGYVWAYNLIAETNRQALNERTETTESVNNGSEEVVEETINYNPIIKTEENDVVIEYTPVEDGDEEIIEEIIGSTNNATLKASLIQYRNSLTALNSVEEENTKTI